jgi:sterol desaturase/sphingolipid hydroxylase (fatty acid hydroxylase superfamily)
MNAITDILRGIAGQIMAPGVSIYWVYLCAAGALAAIVYTLRRGSPRGLLGYLFPRALWLHRSTFHDLAMFVINSVWYSFLLLAPLERLSGAIGTRTWGLLHETFGPSTVIWTGLGPALALSVVVFVLADLAFYLFHRLVHRVPLLWEFHKVHHSAPVLQPLTSLRLHPVDVVLHGAIAGVMLGPALGLAGWLSGGALEPWTIQGINGLLFLALLLGYNLQHSRVWLSFGPLDRWLICPAAHQLHHSADPSHHSRNFGNMLAVWDRLFASQLLPRELELRRGEPRTPLRFGLGARGGAWERDYRSVWRLYLWPLWRVARGIAGVAGSSASRGASSSAARPRLRVRRSPGPLE